MVKTGLILWAGNNEAHDDHLHIEGIEHFHGEPPANNPGMTDSIWDIWIALHEQFGESAYFLDDTSNADWTHMGWYNRRFIAGTNIWSQHAYANALDVGPYETVETQQPFYDFLTKEKEILMLPINKESDKEDIRHIQEMLGTRATGNWDSETQRAVKGLANRSRTGDPKGLDGTHVNGRMYTQALDDRYMQGEPTSIYGTTVKLVKP